MRLKKKHLLFSSQEVFIYSHWVAFRVILKEQTTSVKRGVLSEKRIIGVNAFGARPIDITNC